MPNEDQNRLIDQLYREMYHQLLIYAKCSLGNVSLAEEAVQDTFRIACAKANELLNSPKPKGWLKETLKYVISNIYHSERRYDKLMAEIMLDPNLSEIAPNDSNLDLMYSDLVSKDDFFVLKRIAVEHASILELSEELGISFESCKKRYQRAKLKMKKVLKN